MDSRSLGFLDVSGCGVCIYMLNINCFIRNSRWKCHYLITIRKFGQKFIGLLEALLFRCAQWEMETGVPDKY